MRTYSSRCRPTRQHAFTCLNTCSVGCYRQAPARGATGSFRTSVSKLSDDAVQTPPATKTVTANASTRCGSEPAARASARSRSSSHPVRARERQALAVTSAATVLRHSHSWAPPYSDGTFVTHDPQRSAPAPDGISAYRNGHRRLPRQNRAKHFPLRPARSAAASGVRRRRVGRSRYRPFDSRV
jgi:hypothetical protein